mmetsp:Transcript_1617/g.4811  ORF Transcript_1617/g.4811 Transcript_1617/m.4811 type:complete len:237 (+) Transcript_1617:383-1093(+)
MKLAPPSYGGGAAGEGDGKVDEVQEGAPVDAATLTGESVPNEVQVFRRHRTDQRARVQDVDDVVPGGDAARVSALDGRQGRLQLLDAAPRAPPNRVRPLSVQTHGTPARPHRVVVEHVLGAAGREQVAADGLGDGPDPAEPPRRRPVVVVEVVVFTSKEGRVAGDERAEQRFNANELLVVGHGDGRGKGRARPGAAGVAGEDVHFPLRQRAVGVGVDDVEESVREPLRRRDLQCLP